MRGRNREIARSCEIREAFSPRLVPSCERGARCASGNAESSREDRPELSRAAATATTTITSTAAVKRELEAVDRA